MPDTIIPASATRKMKVRPAQPGLVLRERFEAAEQAREIRDRAMRDAKKILEAAKKKSAHTKRLGREEGRRAGYREVARQVSEVARWKTAASDELVQRVAELACVVARRVLREEIKQHPESVRRMCTEVIRENPPGKKLLVLVHPADMELLNDPRCALAQDPAVQVTFEPSQRVERGGCIVKGELGEVDGRLKIQLEELRRIMLEADHE